MNENNKIYIYVVDAIQAPMHYRQVFDCECTSSEEKNTLQSSFLG